MNKRRIREPDNRYKGPYTVDQCATRDYPGSIPRTVQLCVLSLRKYVKKNQTCIFNARACGLEQRTPPAPIGARAALGVPRGLAPSVRRARRPGLGAPPHRVAARCRCLGRARCRRCRAPGAAEAASASAGVVGLRGWVAGHAARRSQRRGGRRPCRGAARSRPC